MIKQYINKNIIFFGSLFVVLTATARFYFDYSKRFDYVNTNLGQLLQTIASWYGLLAILLVVTALYFLKSEKNTKSAIAWGIALFVFDTIDLAIFEFKAAISSTPSYGMWDALAASFLIPYYAFVSAAIGSFFFFVMLFIKKKFNDNYSQ